MSISDKIKENIVIVVSTTAIGSFSAGWISHKGNIESQGQEQILKTRRQELESIEAKFRTLSREHEALNEKYKALLPKLPTVDSPQQGAVSGQSAGNPEVNAEVAIGEVINGSVATGSAIIKDGSTSYFKSGIRFANNSIVAWSGQGDLMAHKQGDPARTGFFLSFDAEPYKDSGGQSGIVQIKAKALSEIKECTADGYSYHWFLPRVNGVYCIRTRNGKSFAVVQVTKMSTDWIEFDFMYQRNGTNRF